MKKPASQINRSLLTRTGHDAITATENNKETTSARVGRGGSRKGAGPKRKWTKVKLITQQGNNRKKVMKPCFRVQSVGAVGSDSSMLT
jgi:hypothetical protein